MALDVMPGGDCPVQQCLQVILIRQEATVHGGRLTFADIADLSGLPARLRRDMARLVLARFLVDRMPRRLLLQPLVDRARMRIPALAIWLPRTIAGHVLLRGAETPVSAKRSMSDGCLRALRDLDPHTLARMNDFAAVPCGELQPDKAFAFDRSTQAIRTSRRLAADEVVVRYAGFGDGGIAAGDHLTLQVVSGPVRAERGVEAVQSARSMKKVFVRTDDGNVFSAPVEAPRP